ncbi:MAG: choice-of-anchor J domain-containing protein [Candidatus Amulumruptor caecigallinarius]|nr:choice-of-anchor J domain-containing protein [Candidatus Amulumruptor caecigallinarius]
MKLKSYGISLMAAALYAGGMSAAAPTITKISDPDVGGYINKLSDNGAWGVGYGKSVISDVGYSFPRLYDVKGHRQTNLYTSKDATSVGEMMATDVSNDGSIVVGQYKGRPALWRKSTGQWELLPIKNTEFKMGKASDVTPDGKYALGMIQADQEGYIRNLAVWDLTGETPVDITPENLPKPITREGALQAIQQIYPNDISPDGRYISGLVGFSYGEAESWNFVYDMQTKTWKGIGYDVEENADGTYKFTRTHDGYLDLGEVNFSHSNPNVFYGQGYTPEDTPNIYKYDMTTGTPEFIAESDGLEMGAVDNTDAIYASKAVTGPIRNWFVKAGKYWYDFRVMSIQLWDINWMDDITKDEYGYTGTFTSASDDGRVLVATDYSEVPNVTYLIELDKPLSEYASEVNLLGNYAVTPVSGSAFAMIKEIRVQFDRLIEVCGNYNSVQLLDENGNVVANSIGLTTDAGDGHILSATFRNRRLEVGKKYTVVFPAGIVNIQGDKEQKNKEIRASYTGRPQQPVKALSISPEPGTEIKRINSSSNPISLVFDAQIAAVSNESNMALYRVAEDGSRERVSILSGSITGTRMSVYPSLEQRLAFGDKYVVEIPAGTVSDISGADPNEKIEIEYTGAYLPEVPDGASIFSDNFDNGISAENWMLYDGDMNEPNDEMTSWGFIKELPWTFVRDDNQSTDMSAVSHSMYKEPGQSNDWMITRRLYIPDDTAVLSFKAQNYRAANQDKLKVVLLESDDVYTALTPTIIDRFKYYGTTLVDEVQTPGKNEETLAGDWKEYNIKLDAYAGKNIYIAFLNDNRNQSAIFLDDVEVKRDVRFAVYNMSEPSVLRQDELTVRGHLSVESLTEKFKGYSIKLKDSEGNLVSEIADPEIETERGWKLNFTMPQTLPITIGKVANYTLDVTMGEYNEIINASVKNLAVETEKKVVIEEYTGEGCPNCPLGHAAAEIIEKDFPERVYMLAIHTYPGDQFATPQAAQLQTALGFSAAPTGRVNRNPISSPMTTDTNNKLLYKNSGLWYDYVVAELEELAPADIKVTSASYNAEDNKYEVSVDVAYALDMDNQNVNIFTVITEDNLNGTQQNSWAIDDPLMGPWAAGGPYGNLDNAYTFSDVVRTYDGTTHNGTGGYIPASVEAGKVYTANISIPNIRRINRPENTQVTTMLIDAESGFVLNADRRKIAVAAVDGIQADNAATIVKVEGGIVNVACIGEANVNVYSIDGRMLASVRGEGGAQADVTGYHGVAVVIVQTADGVKNFKVMIP